VNGVWIFAVGFSRKWWLCVFLVLVGAGVARS